VTHEPSVADTACEAVSPFDGPVSNDGLPSPGAWPLPPRWQREGHLQTIGAALWGDTGCMPWDWQRQRWTTSDADFIDVDWMRPPAAHTLVVLFHGLEGSSRSHYARALAASAAALGWAVAVPHFRGCSGEPNRAPRVYHSGDHVEIGAMLRRLRDEWPGPMLAVGVSLGGNALLRWLQEAGHSAGQTLRAAAAISAPLDLAAAGAAIDRGLNRVLYARMFLRTMRAKARQKAQQYPGLFDIQRALRARTLRAFDDAFTAPLHGFAGVDDYWRRSSSLPGLGAIRLPTLVLNARNDPFVPAHSLPARVAGDWVRLWQPLRGGHVGFAHVRTHRDWRGDLQALPHHVLGWLARAGGGV